MKAFDLVVIGSRGRNSFARVFLGSIADRLVHICTRPVLVVEDGPTLTHGRGGRRPHRRGGG